MSFSERLGRRREEISASEEDWHRTQSKLTSSHKNRIASSPEYAQVFELVKSQELQEMLKTIWENYADKSQIIGLLFDRTVPKPKFKVVRQEEWKGLASSFVINLIIPLRNQKDATYQAKSTFIQIAVELDIINDVVLAKWGLPVHDSSDEFEISPYAPMKMRFFDSLKDLQDYLIEHIAYKYSLGPRGEFLNLTLTS